MTIKKRVVVPPNSPSRWNRVAELQEKIAKLQERCGHDFRLFKAVELVETAVQGVFTASTIMDMGCVKCALGAKVPTVTTCPRCLSDMREMDGDHLYETYWPNSEAKYRSVQLHSCTSCDLVLAATYYDR